jgi:hypothetical protein
VTEQQLEAIIADLIKRKYAAPEGSADRRLVLAQLNGLRNYEAADGIMEELDPDEWGCQFEDFPDRPAAGSAQILPLDRRSVSHSE